MVRQEVVLVSEPCGTYCSPARSGTATSAVPMAEREDPGMATAREMNDPATDAATGADSPTADVAPSRTTRRTILGAGLGALVATVAASLGRAQPAKAADNEVVQVGQSRLARTVTVFQNQENNNDVLEAKSVGIGNASTGGGAAISGRSDSGNGVIGRSDSGKGVEGRSNAAGSVGVYGFSNGGIGVYAYSGAGHALAGYANGPTAFGVFGQAKDESGFGAVGQNLASQTIGLLGAPKYGVEGRAPNALGYVGVKASAPEAAVALSVDGVARFTRSGRASVPAGKSFVDVDVPGGMTALTIVVATPMVNRSGVYVQSAVPNTTTGEVRINLNKIASATSSTPVAWMVLS